MKMPPACWPLVAIWVVMLPVKAEVDIIELTSNSVEVRVTPDLGGRMLHLSRQGMNNFLRVGNAVNAQPEPRVSPFEDNIGYLGQTIWLGPQSQWWRQQQLNQQRYRDSAVWPPDPYLIFPRLQTVEQTDSAIQLQGLPSPVSGVSLKKRYQLEDNKLTVSTRMVNERKMPVSWDIWLNLRTFADSRILIPVQREGDIRLTNLTDENTAPLRYDYQDALLMLSPSYLSGPVNQHKGKLFIQPGAGWMAGWREGQIIVFKFDLAEAKEIHPEQGQVEFYWHHVNDGDPLSGLMEMELHSPFHHLQPSQSALQNVSLWLFDYPVEWAEQRVKQHILHLVQQL